MCRTLLFHDTPHPESKLLSIAPRFQTSGQTLDPLLHELSFSLILHASLSLYETHTATLTHTGGSLKNNECVNCWSLQR